MSVPRRRSALRSGGVFVTPTTEDVMRKLRLELDALRVESFPTDGPDAGARGTVRGADMLRTREAYCTNGETCKTSCAGGPHCLCPVGTAGVDL
jgi:hypothetical protein